MENHMRQVIIFLTSAVLVAGHVQAQSSLKTDKQGCFVSSSGERFCKASAASSGNQPYKNCNDARAHGDAPVYSSNPRYGLHLDRDGDGVGCEPYKGKN